MTVCIASFAAKSKAIVTVSDKSVTYGGKDSIPLVSDTEAQKFLRIGETFWYTLTAGDPSFAFSVVKAAEKTLTKRTANTKAPTRRHGICSIAYVAP